MTSYHREQCEGLAGMRPDMHLGLLTWMQPKRSAPGATTSLPWLPGPEYQNSPTPASSQRLGRPRNHGWGCQNQKPLIGTVEPTAEARWTSVLEQRPGRARDTCLRACVSLLAFGPPGTPATHARRAVEGSEKRPPRRVATMSLDRDQRRHGESLALSLTSPHTPQSLRPPQPRPTPFGEKRSGVTSRGLNFEFLFRNHAILCDVNDVRFFQSWILI